MIAATILAGEQPIALKVTSRASVRYDSHGFDRRTTIALAPNGSRDDPPLSLTPSSFLPHHPDDERVSNTLFFAREMIECGKHSGYDPIPCRTRCAHVTTFEQEVSETFSPLAIRFSPYYQSSSESLI